MDLHHRDDANVGSALSGRTFWSRGFDGCTVGFDEEGVRCYIEERKEHEKRQAQCHPILDCHNGPFGGPSSYLRRCRWP